MTDLSTLPAAVDDNQLGAHLRRLWDTRPAGMTSGKWSPKLGRFVTLEEWLVIWLVMKEQKEATA